MSLTIELAGLELHGFHGVEADERRDGQRFLVDVELDVPDTAARSDRIEDAVDYREVVALVRGVSDGARVHAAGGARDRARRGARSRASPSSACASACASRTCGSTFRSSTRRSAASVEVPAAARP